MRLADVNVDQIRSESDRLTKLGAQVGWIIVGGFLLILLLLGAFFALLDSTRSSRALEQMEVAFIGNPNQAQIQARLDRAMTLYNLPITEENYSRAGSVLVTLRREVGPSEMAILDRMIISHAPGVNISFPDMAAIAATALAQ